MALLQVDASIFSASPYLTCGAVVLVARHAFDLSPSCHGSGGGGAKQPPPLHRRSHSLGPGTSVGGTGGGSGMLQTPDNTGDFHLGLEYLQNDVHQLAIKVHTLHTHRPHPRRRQASRWPSGPCPIPRVSLRSWRTSSKTGVKRSAVVCLVCVCVLWC